MSLALCRIDDRLIHGQVVLGWGRPLHAAFVVLVDDGIASSSWEQDLYRMAVPSELELDFANTTDAIADLPAWDKDPRPGILLTGDILTMSVLHDAYPGLLSKINLGGVHHREDRVERLRYVYLTKEEQQLLKRMAAHGAVITAQDLPTSAPVGLAELAP